MINIRLSREQGLYIGALCLALFVRLVGLGVAPLSEYEARWALGALHIAGRASTEFVDQSIGYNPLYTFLTASLFSIFKASDFTARFWPAFLGASIVLVPYFFQRTMGSWAALILAFGLALDPGLTATARLAGSPILALTFTAWMFASLVRGRRVLSALFLGLSLLSGTAFLHGALILGLTALGTRLWKRQTPEEREEDLPDTIKEKTDLLAPRNLDWVVLVGTVLLVGSAFARYPAGLSAFAGALPAYLSGWVQSSGVPVSQMLIGLIFDQPLAVSFGLIGLGIGLGNRTIQRAAIWTAIALGIVLLYPARQPFDLIWVLVPVWVLAAEGIYKVIKFDFWLDWVSWAQSGLIFVLVIMFGLNLASLSRAPQGQAQLVGQLVLIGLVVLGILTFILIGLGWSWRAARQGTGLGLLAGLLLSVLSSLFNLTAASPVNTTSIWSIAPSAGETRLLEDTLQKISEWSTGRRDMIDIAATVNSTSLRWSLRDYPNARFLTLAQVRGLSDPPAIVITESSNRDPILASSYRGQDFSWRVFPAWSPGIMFNYRAWMGFSNFPATEEQVILWARADLFPGDILAAGDVIDPSLEIELQPGD